MRANSQISYRPEIDGLRALSVLSVIIFHFEIELFNKPLLSGGFLGVDIFFVISGYLITSIILKELKSKKGFSFLNFYERRIRRIIPLLVFVILVCFPFAYLFLLPSSFVEFAKSALYSLGFSSNFYFHYSGQGYGAEHTNLLPLLHTWSLSVEEQFYIIFPIVLFILFKFFRNFIFHIFFISFIVSISLAEWGTSNHPHFNFYFLPTRGWEILAGAMISYLENNGLKQKLQKNLFLTSFFIYLGILLILISFINFPSTPGRILGSYHPSFKTFLPILGSCLIIWYAKKSNIIIKILSSKLLVFIGLISYSLYLWHFPIYSFSIYIDFFNDSNLQKIFLILLTFVLSILTYYFIEKPARNKNNKFRKVFNVLLIFYLTIILFSLFIIYKKGFFENRIPKITTDNLSLFKTLKNSNSEVCEDNNIPCIFNESSNKKVFLIGDSLAGSIAFDLKEEIVKKNYQFTTLMRGGCLLFPGFDRFDISSNLMSPGCNSKYYKKTFNFLNSQNDAIIIIVGRYPLYFDGTNFNNQEGGKEPGGGEYKFFKNGNYNNIKEAFRNSILKLSKNNQIILVYPVPEVGWHLPRKLNSNLMLKSQNEITKYLVKQNYLTTSYEIYKKRNYLSFKLLDSINNENIYRVYPHKIFCNSQIKNRCITHDNKNFFYYDYVHLLGKGSSSVVSLIMDKIKSLKF